MEKELRCCKCNWKWKQRGKFLPKVCPSCKNPNWSRKSAKELIELMLVR